MKEFFDAAPKLIGVTSFVVLFMTVVHEWDTFTCSVGICRR
jgi:hypothetical protein